MDSYRKATRLPLIDDLSVYTRIEEDEDVHVDYVNLMFKPSSRSRSLRNKSKEGLVEKLALETVLNVCSYEIVLSGWNVLVIQDTLKAFIASLDERYEKIK